MEATLVKVDKNGTKYYASDRCPKCGGSGHIHGYEFIQGGVCFKCNGSGKGYQTWTVRTPEYQAKLDAKRLAKLKEKAPEENARYFKRLGADEQGIVYVVLGNTWEIKDELKGLGARFDRCLGWYFPEAVTGYSTLPVDMKKMVIYNDVGIITANDTDKVRAYIREQQTKHEEMVTQKHSEYVGNVGEKLSCKVTCINVCSYDSQFGICYINILEDEANNVLVWKTGTSMERENRYIIAGTIKAHETYNGKKQTIMTRCKIQDMES